MLYASALAAGGAVRRKQQKPPKAKTGTRSACRGFFGSRNVTDCAMTVILVCSDGARFVACVAVLQMSLELRQLCIEAGEEEQPLIVPLPSVSRDTLRTVLAYCSLKALPPRLAPADAVRLFAAADYLDIPCLLAATEALAFAAAGDEDAARRAFDIKAGDRADRLAAIEANPWAFQASPSAVL